MIPERFMVTGKRVDNGKTVTGYLSKSRYQGKGELVPCIDYEESGVMISSCVDPKSVEPVAAKLKDYYMWGVRHGGNCPNCNAKIDAHNAASPNYCYECGQRLDWGQDV